MQPAKLVRRISPAQLVTLLVGLAFPLNSGHLAWSSEVAGPTMPNEPKRCLVKVTVGDFETREPLACRAYLSDSTGSFYFARSSDPNGSAVTYDVDRSPQSREKHTTVSAHPFAYDVPAGAKLTLTLERGKEYVPVTREFEASGSSAEVVVPLLRWIDMPARGWYSGDTHVHRKLEECPNLIEAEDLHVAFPLTYWVREAYQPADRGPQAKDVRPELIKVGDNRFLWPVNTEYELFTVNGKPHTQGAVFVLNHKQPLSLAAPPVAPIGHAAREAGGLLDLDKHSWNWTVMIVPLMNADLFELANNHVWRTNFLFRKWTIEMTPTDWGLDIGPEGVDEWGWIDWGFKTYYAFLNCGFRLRPSAGTGSGVHPVPLGFGRVYVHVGPELTYERWVDGLNAGHSFVTTGPVLPVMFNGKLPGTVFRNPTTDEQKLRVSGTADSIHPMETIEIVMNGDVVQTIKPANTQRDAGGFSSPIDVELPITTSAWVAVRCFERDENNRRRYAHTAPVHFEIDGPVKPKRREVNYFISRMEQEIRRNEGVLAADEVAEYRRALAIYLEIAKRARD